MPGVAQQAIPAAHNLPEHWSAVMDDCVVSIAWSPDGEHLSAASASGSVCIFNVESGGLERSFQAHEFGATSVKWRPAGDEIATAGQDGRIRLWHPHAGKLIRELEGGAAWVEHLAWSPSGTYLASAAGGKLRLWTSEGILHREYPQHPNTIAAIAWRPNASELASACYGQIQIWRPDNDRPEKTLQWKGSMLALAWSPDGQYLCHGNQDATVHFWIVRNSKELQMWGYPTKIRELAWDRRSRYLATGGGSQVTVWDCSGRGPANTKPIVLKYHEDLLSQLVYQRNGPLLASGCIGGRIAIWEGKNRQPLFTAAMPSAIAQLAWSGDGTRLCVGCEDGTLAVLETSESPAAARR